MADFKARLWCFWRQAREIEGNILLSPSIREPEAFQITENILMLLPYYEKTSCFPPPCLFFPAFLPAQSAPPASTDVLRLSGSLKSAGGTVEGFMPRSRAQGLVQGQRRDERRGFSTPVIVRDETTHEQSYSKTEFMSFHILARIVRIRSTTPRMTRFVKLYRDNSRH